MKHALSLALFSLCAVVQATEWQDSAAVTALFKKEGVTGTFVVHDVAKDTNTGHDEQRAGKRFIPASTFKIPNSLIALSTGAVASVDEIVPYDGKPVARAEWAKSMGLREAIKMSNVPVYQELARRIGMDRMRGALVRMNYGNNDTGTVVDRFWLDGPLEISALEQAVFLARLAQGQLPFENMHMEAVRAIARQHGPADLYAKTGWGKRPGQPDIGWWVGWIKKEGKLYTFALNIDIPHGAEDKRVSLAKASLHALGLL
ncbi:class D beta-lactamase [Massilia aurea]|uniref:class D beta-lactamase n=1 Tax=Massilia aurea TaxID=373040 RepID=UPI00351D6D6D